MNGFYLQNRTIAHVISENVIILEEEVDVF